MKLSFLVYFVIILFCSTCSSASDDFLARPLSTHEQVARLLALSLQDQHRITICFNYGCHNKQEIYYSDRNIKHIKSLFKKTETDPLSELEAIAQAIAYMENIAGQQSPVHNDRAKNINDNGNGRMDCIDSTVNTTNYLRFISRLSVLKQYRLIQPVYRSPFMMGQHWSARILELSSGKTFAVDSWASDNGQKPLIQNVSNWKTRDSQGIVLY